MFRKNNTQDVLPKHALTQRDKISPFSVSEFESLTDAKLKHLLHECIKTIKLFAPYAELAPAFERINDMIGTSKTDGRRNAVFFATTLITLWDKFQPEEPPFRAFPKAAIGAIKTGLSNIESALTSDPSLDNAPYQSRM